MKRQGAHYAGLARVGERVVGLNANETLLSGDILYRGANTIARRVKREGGYWTGFVRAPGGLSSFVSDAEWLGFLEKCCRTYDDPALGGGA